ncbi:MAG: hypothetical protein ACREX8_09395 [Gammaproteobacteria bacterium]
MAVPAGHRFPIEFDTVFPEGAYVTGVEPVFEYGQQTGGGVKRQAKDERSGELLWAVSVTDPSGKGRQAAVTVKIAAPHQPVPPETIAGTPFRPVLFDGLTATPYLDDHTKRLAYSLRATGMRAVQARTASRSSGPAEQKPAA